MQRIQDSLQSRRKFLLTTAKTVGAASLLPLTFSNASAHASQMTIREAMDIILRSVPGSPFANTVDTIKSGNAENVITGIVTTMFATIDVIEKAAALKANFIIAHEPTFYNHADDTGWLANDKVFAYKDALLKKYGITIWRFHDYIHTIKPDGVMQGVVAALGWQKYFQADKPYHFVIEPSTLRTLAENIKHRLNIPYIRVIGKMDQRCEKVVLMPGAPGGRAQIQMLMREEPDVLIAGELQEWETSEYLRDAVSIGLKRSLILLGHVPSEEPGMEWLVPWLQERLAGISIHHIPSQIPFNWV